MGPRAGLDRCGKSRHPPTGIRCPDRPARSQSLYRLSYTAHEILITIDHKPFLNETVANSPVISYAQNILLNAIWFATVSVKYLFLFNLGVYQNNAEVLKGFTILVHMIHVECMSYYQLQS